MEINYLFIITRIVIIIAGGYALNYFLQRVYSGLIHNRAVPESMIPMIKGITKWFIIILVILLICRQLGISATVIMTSLSGVLVMVAIGFVASWSILSHISSSFLLLVFSPFNFGDTIEIREPDKEYGVKGKVVALNIFFTTLKCVDEDGSESLIRIPNNLFFQKIVICHTGTKTEKLKVTMDNDIIKNKETE